MSNMTNFSNLSGASFAPIPEELEAVKRAGDPRGLTLADGSRGFFTARNDEAGLKDASGCALKNAIRAIEGAWLT
jgi:hypothetical protein